MAQNDAYESFATLTTHKLHYELQTLALVREGAPRRRAKQLSGKRMEKEKSGYGLLPRGIGRLTVGHNINSSRLGLEGVETDLSEVGYEGEVWRMGTSSGPLRSQE
jgi:hypothetical protein